MTCLFSSEALSKSEAAGIKTIRRTPPSERIQHLNDSTTNQRPGHHVSSRQAYSFSKNIWTESGQTYFLLPNLSLASPVWMAIPMNSLSDRSLTYTFFSIFSGLLRVTHR